MICLMTMRSAKTRTLVTEESSRRAAFTIAVLSLNTVTRPSARDAAAPTSVSCAMVPPVGKKKKKKNKRNQSIPGEAFFYSALD